MKNTPTLLIDTNIWIDAFDGDRKQHMRAHVLLDTAFERGVTLAFAVSSLKDVYYALSSALKRQSRTVNDVLSEEDARSAEAYAWACVQNMQEIATPVAVDVSDVWLAGKFRSQMHDFEDALVAAAASHCHADVLVTNDERFLRHSPVNAMDAADALTYITLSSL
ncbi:PIN domain-containing protein [uncultured Enorma sp.]|uniref:type II toxin-antitoxin system VapC family toxin n=1 Tax=uncultured Enorma sp. TaxID=1714346 RepID=UPI0026297DF1|nr:PIN domain-containing protein [uncultured Enorma sp.]